MAKLVMIPKGCHLTQELTLHRLLSSLDAEGQLFWLTETRLEKEIEKTGGLSKNQFRFRKGCQTTIAESKVPKMIKITES